MFTNSCDNRCQQHFTVRPLLLLPLISLNNIAHQLLLRSFNGLYHNLGTSALRFGGYSLNCR